MYEYDIKGQKDGKDVTGYKKDWTDMSTSWVNFSIGKIILPFYRQD